MSQRFRMAFFLVLAFAHGRLIADDPAQPAPEPPRGAVRVPPRVAALAGAWKLNPAFDRLLGMPARQQMPPSTLQLSLAARNAPVHTKETLTLFVNTFEIRMKHTIVATGAWKSDAKKGLLAGRDSKLIVTTKDGVTYLWFGSPTNALFGAEAHLLLGGASKTQLVLDFSGIFPPRMHKAASIFGYVDAGS